ncbi:hypothetical protein [Chitinophaga caseinilytica]|uniref:hypothetical protein n=1 Tax=Chitinophaga caseinilytica TaxID=2267521 RepID=UPI003C2C8CE6
MQHKTIYLTISAAILLAACNNGGKKTTSDSIPETPAPVEAPAATAAFSLEKVPMSDKPLGTFPYVNLAKDYANAEQNPIAKGDSALFWVGDHFEVVKGNVFFSRVKGGGTWSDAAFLQAVGDSVVALGGVKVNESQVPSDRITEIEQNRLRFNSGYGFIGFKPTATYVIRRADNIIWVQATPTDDGASAGWIVVETNPK